MGYLDGFDVTFKKWSGHETDTGKRHHAPVPRRADADRSASPSACTAATSSTGTRTAWRSASAASCAPACARPGASTCGARDNDPDRTRRRPASGSGSSTRSTTCGASTATCASRPARPRPSPRRSCSSSPSRTAADAIYTKAELLVGDDGRPQQLPWENWDGGFDDGADTSAWMRATAPAGDDEFEGIVAWAGELGYGVAARRGWPAARGRGRPRRPPRPTAATTTTTGTAGTTDARRDAHVRGASGRGAPSCLFGALGVVLLDEPGAQRAVSWSPPCSASPSCSSPRGPTSWPPSR